VQHPIFRCLSPSYPTIDSSENCCIPFPLPLFLPPAIFLSSEEWKRKERRGREWKLIRNG